MNGFTCFCVHDEAMFRDRSAIVGFHLCMYACHNDEVMLIFACDYL